MRFGNIEIYDKRFKSITFDGAKKECDLLGNGWRLPTEIEMSGLLNFLVSLGNNYSVGI